jgi:hypothetical protein
MQHISNMARACLAASLISVPVAAFASDGSFSGTVVDPRGRRLGGDRRRHRRPA